MNQVTAPATPAPMAEPPIFPNIERRIVPTTGTATNKIMSRFP